MGGLIVIFGWPSVQFPQNKIANSTIIEFSKKNLYHTNSALVVVLTLTPPG